VAGRFSFVKTKLARTTLSRIAMGLAAAAGLALALLAGASTHYFTASWLGVKPYPLRRIDLELPQTRNGIEYYGTVRLKVYINADGGVDRVDATESTVPAKFRDDAEKAFSQARWEPGRILGIRVKSLKRVEIDFEPPVRGLDQSFTQPGS
jgi:outer membrane biosynthesis protein TonB